MEPNEILDSIIIVWNSGIAWMDDFISDDNLSSRCIVQDSILIQMLKNLINLSCCIKCNVAQSSRCQFELGGGSGSSSRLQASGYCKNSGAVQHHDWDAWVLQLTQEVWDHHATTKTTLFMSCLHHDTIMSSSISTVTAMTIVCGQNHVQDSACSAPCSWLPYNNCNIAQWWWWSMHPFHLDQTSRNQRKVSSPKAAVLCPLPAVRAVMSTSSSIVSMMLSSPMCTLSYTMLLHSPPVTPAAAIPCHCIAWPWWQLLQLAKEDVNLGRPFWQQWLHLPFSNHWMQHLKGARPKMQVS